ncbi:Alkaline phosphatase precursor [compost metagenome]
MKGLKSDMWWIAGICILLIAGVIVVQWVQHGEKDLQEKIPYDLVTTFKGDGRTSRAFTWFTNDPDVEGIVQIAQGTEANALEDTASLISTYQVTSSEITNSNGKDKAVHKAEVTGLQPGHTYVYRVGSGRSEEWSEAYTFTTEKDNDNHFTFINVTDSQGVTEADFGLWGKTLNQAFSVFPDAKFIVHNGDLTEEPDNEAAWSFFMNKAQGRLAQVPLMPVTGNHDEVDKNADAYMRHFNLPVNGDEGSIPGTNYSFDYGHVHFVILNTESNIKGQLNWLANDLESSNQQWTIVAMHRPAYGGNTYDKVEKWVKVFDEYGVDLVLQGHNHEYSRSYPLRDGVIVNESEGTVYVTTNTAGQKFNEKKEDQFYHAVHFQNYKQMFAGITANGNKLVYEAYDVDGEKLDEFVLTK